MTMQIKTNITTTDKKEFENVRIALSVIQRLEHMYDGVNLATMETLGVVYDILADITFIEDDIPKFEKGE